MTVKYLLFVFVLSFSSISSVYSQPCVVTKLNSDRNQIDVDSLFTHPVFGRCMNYTITDCKSSLLTQLYQGDFAVKWNQYKKGSVKKHLETANVGKLYVYHIDYYENRYYLLAVIKFYK